MFIPRRLTNIIFPLYIIKINKETMEPIRDENGFCIECALDEPGEMIGKIVPGHALKGFQGYRDKKANEKKVLNDVFKKGDIYFRSGDILVKDELGYFSFLDRAGDTYRWKGENVSTQEVEAITSNILDSKEASSFGVQVPGMDGRAGMIAIPFTDDVASLLNKLYDGLQAKLPSYARPVFIRLVKELDMTGNKLL